MKLLIACVWFCGVTVIAFYLFFGLLFLMAYIVECVERRKWSRLKREMEWCNCSHCTAERVRAHNREYDLAHFDLQEFIRR